MIERTKFMENWVEMHLTKKLEMLEHLKRKAKGEEVAKIDETINIIISSLKQPEDMSIIELYNSEQKELDYCDQFLSLIAPLIKDLYYPYIEPPENSLNAEYVIRLLYDFFTEALDDDLKNVFLSLFYRRQTLLHIGNYDLGENQAEMLYLPYFNEAHVATKSIDSISDFATLAHEYGHAIELLENYHSDMMDNNFLFSEVISIFFEILSLDYLRTKNSFKKEVQRLIEDMHLNMIFMANAITIEAKLFKKWKKLNANQKDKLKIIEKDIKRYRSYFFLEGNDFLQQLIRNRYSAYMKYPSSYTIAIEIFMLYLKDREQGKRMLKKYLSINTGINSRYFLLALKDIGLIPSEHLDEYVKYISNFDISTFKSYTL